MSIERVARIGETDVFEAELRTAAGMQARVLTYGAVLRDLIVPHSAGPRRVILGLERAEDYAVPDQPYLGAIVGRYANRIGGAQFELDGECARLQANEGKNQLHGGLAGFSRRIWTIVDHEPASVTLALVSADGDMGYPGRLVALCTYTLIEPATLRLSLEATSDRPTPVNLSTHIYYNLDGAPTIEAHRLMIAGRYITPTDAEKIPTGEILTVAGTPYDFRSARPIGAEEPDSPRYDINYVLDGGDEDLAHAATVASDRNGLRLELWTTEPGLQFYDGHLLDDPAPGLDGARYGRRAGLCLEPQRFPDGPNKPHFPPCILEPGLVSRQVSELRFSEPVSGAPART